MKISAQKLLNFWSCKINNSGMDNEKSVLVNIDSKDPDYLSRLLNDLGCKNPGKVEIGNKEKKDTLVISEDEYQALIYSVHGVLLDSVCCTDLNSVALYMNLEDAKLDIICLAKLLYAAKGAVVSAPYAPPTLSGRAIGSYVTKQDGDSLKILTRRYSMPSIELTSAILDILLHLIKSDKVKISRHILEVNEDNLSEVTEKLNNPVTKPRKQREKKEKQPKEPKVKVAKEEKPKEIKEAKEPKAKKETKEKKAKKVKEDKPVEIKEPDDFEEVQD